MKINRFLLSGAVLFLALLGSIMITPNKTTALSGDSFQAGKIIDDGVFKDEGSMTTSQIQQFLDSKVPVCDTNGTQPYAGTTRAAYGASRGNPAPYICLKDYTETVRAVSSSDGYCSGSTTSGTKTAARIIYDVARACDINPQVILVMLQKEQSLITDDWPWQRQYDVALGYGCPDTAPCDEEYFGFFNQVWQAANAFNRYAANPTWYSYRSGRNNTIYWHPDLSRCGSSSVYIQNQATANLYIYTPYRPNQAALNNLYGTGDSCSSYGNRNFWRMFNDWFGSTQGSVQISRNLQFSPSEPVAGGLTSVSFRVKNTSDIPITIDKLVVAVRDDDNNNLNFPSVSNVDLDPGEEYTYYQSKRFFQVENLTFDIVAYRDSGWTYTWPKSTNSNIRRTRNTSVTEADVVISRSLYHSPADGLVGDEKAVSFKITNRESVSVHTGKFTVAVRDENNNNLNYDSEADIVLEPGETYEYYQRKIFDEENTHRIYIANYRPSRGWSTSWPKQANSKVITDRSYELDLPDVRITRNLYHSPTSISAGQTKKVSFKIKNFEDRKVTIPKLVVAARDENNNNENFPTVYDIELDPGETYEYYQEQPLTSGEYSIWVAAYSYDSSWSYSWPFNYGHTTQRSFTVN